MGTNSHVVLIHSDRIEGHLQGDLVMRGWARIPAQLKLVVKNAWPQALDITVTHEKFHADVTIPLGLLEQGLDCVSLNDHARIETTSTDVMIELRTWYWWGEVHVPVDAIRNFIRETTARSWQ